MSINSIWGDYMLFGVEFFRLKYRLSTVNGWELKSIDINRIKAITIYELSEADIMSGLKRALYGETKLNPRRVAIIVGLELHYYNGLYEQAL